MVTEADLATGCVFPSLEKVREISASIATSVARIAIERGLATEALPDDLRGHIEALMYQPAYESEG